LLEERHVTRAAARVGLSQPAASRALARLRALLGDPLLVRARGGLVATARAEALREPVRAAMTLIGGALAPPQPFDPARAVRTVRILTDDYSELVLFPGLLARLTSRAPGIDIVVPPPSALSTEALERGDADFFVAPLRGRELGASGVRGELLYEERFVCVVSKTHPFAKRRPSIAKFAAARHALVAPRGARGGRVDDALAAVGKSRRVALLLPHFLVAPFIVASSDLVLTLGERVARALMKTLPLAAFEPPVELEPFRVGVHWHERSDGDPALAWVRGELRHVANAGGRAPRR
jgi:DNA-binding transcriptional LysR family regulator